jgi:plasmid stability protein
MDGRGMEEEVRDILCVAAQEEETPVGGLGTEIASLLRKSGLEAEIPELRKYEIKLTHLEGTYPRRESHS